MTRIISPELAAEAEKPSVTMAVLVELNYDSGTIRVHDGVGPLTFSPLLLMEDGDNLLTEVSENLATEGASVTFLGLGQLGGIEAIEENIEVIARSVNLTASGIDPALLTEALAEQYQNRTVTIYLAMLNPNTGQIVASPEIIWEGRINQQTITLGRGEASVQVSCEHRLRREPRIARYTDADQRQVFAGDRFFDLTHTIEGFVSKWGARDVGYGGPGFNPRGPGSGGGLFSQV